MLAEWDSMFLQRWKIYKKGDFLSIFSNMTDTFIWKQLLVELSVKLRPSCHKICQNWQGLTKSNVHACDTVTAVGFTNPIDTLALHTNLISFFEYIKYINLSMLTCPWNKCYFWPIYLVLTTNRRGRCLKSKHRYTFFLIISF